MSIIVFLTSITPWRSAIIRVNAPGPPSKGRLIMGCLQVICAVVLLPVCTNMNISSEQTMTSLMTSSGVMSEGRGRTKNNAMMAHLRRLIEDIWPLVMGKSWISVLWGAFFFSLFPPPPPNPHRRYSPALTAGFNYQEPHQNTCLLCLDTGHKKFASYVVRRKDVTGATGLSH